MLHVTNKKNEEIVVAFIVLLYSIQQLRESSFPHYFQLNYTHYTLHNYDMGLNSIKVPSLNTCPLPGRATATC